MYKQHAVTLVVLAIAAAFTAGACGGDEPPPQDPSTQPGYGYNTPQPGYTQPTPTYTAPPAGTTPAQPAANPLALPCQADGGLCGTHKCNLTAQRCAFPCTGPQDCMQGTNCMAGICLPGGTP